MRVHANRDSALVLAAQASKAVPKITTIPELKGIHMEADARLAMIRHFLCFCKDADIIRSFDHEAIIKHLDQMKEEPAVPQTSFLDGPQQPVQG